MTQPVFSNAGFEQPIALRKGSDFKIELRMFAGQLNGTPFDLTGATVKARLTKEGDPEAHYDFVGAVTDPTNGVATVTLTATVTQGLAPSPPSQMSAPGYKWECKVKLPGGQIVPFCYGSARVLDSEIEPW